MVIVSDLWRKDASTLSRMLDERAVTPSELLQVYLDRCDRLEPALNAFVYLDREGAKRAAEQATLRQRDGRRRSALDGIPISVKDNLHVKGMPTSWGSLLFQNEIAQKDDIFAERLRHSGAIILGKTTTPEFALLGRTESRLSGITRNPWDLALTPGGSSGGAVAAVAAGMVPLSIGTDSGGSARIPASLTGVVGMRPSNGRIPRRYGVPPMALDFQTIGLVGRTTADIGLLLGIVGGEDIRDPISWSPSIDARDCWPPRIGWFSQIGNERADAEVEHTHRQGLEKLSERGCAVEQCEPPFDVEELRSIWNVLTAVGAARAMYHRPDWESKATDQIAELVHQGLSISATEYVQTLDRLQEFRAMTHEKWGNFDALLTPTAAAPAWPVDLDCPQSIGGRQGSVATQGMFCGWVNALGLPAISVPGLPHPDGRPIGLQIICPNKSDDLALIIGAELESRQPWVDRWPALATG